MLQVEKKYNQVMFIFQKQTLKKIFIKSTEQKHLFLKHGTNLIISLNTNSKNLVKSKQIELEPRHCFRKIHKIRSYVIICYINSFL